jgi:WD40 repeat protein
VAGADFDPSRTGDPQRLATVGRDGLLKFWDLPGRDPLLLRGHGAGVAAVAFSHDGERLATASMDGTVRGWDAATGKPLFRVQAAGVGRLAFSPDGRWLVAGGGNFLQPNKPGVLTVRDARDGRELRALSGHTHVITAVAFSPDGRLLASASGGDALNQPGEVKVWDTAEWRERFSSPGPAQGCVSGLVFTADGRTLALAAGDGTVPLLDATTGRERAVLRGHDERVYRIAAHPRVASLASVDLVGTMIFWDADAAREAGRVQASYTRAAGLAYSADGERVALVLFNFLNGRSELTLWDPKAGTPVLSLPGQITVAFSPDGRRLAAVAGGNILVQPNTVAVWDATPLEGR